jgi:AcrR family transcriptional regulator
VKDAEVLSTAAPEGEHRLRADALRNRERIVAAARDAFIAYGADAPLDEIARRAGVGNATLYRHFSDRRQLIREVMIAAAAELTAETRAALAEEPDAFAALRRVVHRAADRRGGAFFSVLSGCLDDDPAVRTARDALLRAAQGLLDAAQQCGRLRPDAGIGDLMLALAQLGRPLPGMRGTDLDRFVHRHLDLFLDGLLAPSRSVLTGPSATLDDLPQLFDPGAGR